jgi:hypothetical protein
MRPFRTQKLAIILNYAGFSGDCVRSSGEGYRCGWIPSERLILNLPYEFLHKLGNNHAAPAVQMNAVSMEQPTIHLAYLVRTSVE